MALLHRFRQGTAGFLTWTLRATAARRPFSRSVPRAAAAFGPDRLTLLWSYCAIKLRQLLARSTIWHVRGTRGPFPAVHLGRRAPERTDVDGQALARTSAAGICRRDSFGGSRRACGLCLQHCRPYAGVHWRPAGERAKTAGEAAGVPGRARHATAAFQHRSERRRTEKTRGRTCRRAGQSGGWRIPQPVIKAPAAAVPRVRD
jgi:hypothetical protein